MTDSGESDNNQSSPILLAVDQDTEVAMTSYFNNSLASTAELTTLSRSFDPATDMPCEVCVVLYIFQHQLPLPSTTVAGIWRNCICCFARTPPE